MTVFKNKHPAGAKKISLGLEMKVPPASRGGEGKVFFRD